MRLCESKLILLVGSYSENLGRELLTENFYVLPVYACADGLTAGALTSRHVHVELQPFIQCPPSASALCSIACLEKVAMGFFFPYVLVLVHN